jgi:hypothetical protein
MEFATASKIVTLIVWPFIFILFLYFKDKEKFKKKLKAMLAKDD